MRAFMSKSDERRNKEIDADQLGFASAFLWNEMAEREARAILAETEPYEWYPGLKGVEHLRSSITTRDYASYRVACDTLAEALAAFVGEK